LPTSHRLAHQQSWLLAQSNSRADCQRQDEWHACTSSYDLHAALPQYQREFGFVLEDRAIIVDDVRVRATGRAADLPTAEHISSDPGQPGTPQSHRIDGCW
jgi:hypothetical protein